MYKIFFISLIFFSISCMQVRTIQLSPDITKIDEDQIKRFNKNQEKMEKQLQQQIENYLSDISGTVAISLNIKHLNFYYGLNDHQHMHAASTMKVPVMIEVFRQADKGRFSMQDSLPVINSFKSIIDGSPYSIDLNMDSSESLYQQIGGKETIFNLTYQMITTSSNLATNLLIEMVSAEKIMSSMKKLGAKEIRVLRGVEDIKAYRAGKSNTTTAYDLSLIMQAILDGDSDVIKNSKSMLAILSGQKFRGKIPALLPESARVANKTGSITGIDHDTAIIFPEFKNPYVLTVLTKDIADQPTAMKVIADISKIIYNWYLSI